MSENIHAFLSQWTTAERAGGAETLATLLTNDFSGVGPLGFVLPRPAWLDCDHQGLTYEQFSLEEIQIRLHADVAVVTARNNARGGYRGQPLPEALRATIVIVPKSEALELAALHMSSITGTNGFPPMPRSTHSAESSAATNEHREGR